MSDAFESNVLFYKESPLERIVDVHWKKKKPDDGGGGEPPEGLGPCGPLTLFPSSDGSYVGVSIIHVNLGAVATVGMEGTWLQPTDMPPVDWTQIGPPTWNYAPIGAQIYVPGNGASSVTISATGAASLKWWIRPGKAWTDPSIWNQRPAGGNNYASPAGDPDGTGTSFVETIEKNPIVPPPDNPNNFGTTIQFVADTTAGGIIVLDVEHNNCPEGAPSEVPPHP